MARNRGQIGKREVSGYRRKARKMAAGGIDSDIAALEAIPDWQRTPVQRVRLHDLKQKRQLLAGQGRKK